jgi:short-subunit dehydrogenase
MEQRTCIWSSQRRLQYIIYTQFFRRHGVRADYIPADLSKLVDIETLWSEVKRLHPAGIDILLNNAGRVRDHLEVLAYPDKGSRCAAFITNLISASQVA